MTVMFLPLVSSNMEISVISSCFLKAYAGEEIEPDEWDLQMIADAENVNDGNTMTMDELEKELGIAL